MAECPEVYLERTLYVLLTAKFFTYQTRFLMPNQQFKCTEGSTFSTHNVLDRSTRFSINHITASVISPPFPFGRICFVVLVMKKGGESS